MTDHRPDHDLDPAVARRNRNLGLAVLGVVLFVMFLSYLQRGSLFHVLFKVG